MRKDHCAEKIKVYFGTRFNRLFSMLFGSDFKKILVSLSITTLVCFAIFLKAQSEDSTLAEYENIIINSVGSTAFALFSIIFASMAFLLTIIENTRRISSADPRWFDSMYEVVRKFRLPIILSLSLAMLNLIAPITVELLEGYWEYFSFPLVFIVLFVNVFLIVVTLDLTMSMVSFFKAGVDVSSNSDTGREVSSFIVIEDEDGFRWEMGHINDIAQDSITGLIESLKLISSLSYDSKWRDEHLSKNRERMVELGKRLNVAASDLLIEIVLLRDSVLNFETEHETSDALFKMTSDYLGNLNVISSDVATVNDSLEEKLSILKTISRTKTDETHPNLVMNMKTLSEKIEVDLKKIQRSVDQAHSLCKRTRKKIEARVYET